MNKDIKNQIGIFPVLAPIAYTATATSGILDTQGYESVAMAVSVGAFTFTGTNKITVTMEESNTTATGDFTTVASAQLIGAYTVLDAAADAGTTQKVGYTGNKRYLRVVLTEAGTVSTVVSVQGIVSNARIQPAADVAVTATT